MFSMNNSKDVKSHVFCIALQFTKNSGVSELALAAQCVVAACDDAGVDPGEIDGLVSFTLDSTDEIELARAIGAGDLTFYSKINYGGGAAVGTIAQAVMAIATGQASSSFRESYS